MSIFVNHRFVAESFTSLISHFACDFSIDPSAIIKTLSAYITVNTNS